MDFIFQSSKLVLGGTITVYGESREVIDLSYVNEVLEVFDMGYYLLTGKTPQEEGWIPRILTQPEFEAVVDECCPSQPELKRALGFCCLWPESGGGLELIVRGNESLPLVLLTLAHESGHARQRVLNPEQVAAGLDTNTGAIREAEAFAFEVALVRVLGEATGLNVSRLPDRPEIRSFIDDWIAYTREDVYDLSEEHNRGLLLLWMAVLKDSTLEALGRELRANSILSPESLFLVHQRLVKLPAGLVEDYAAALLVDVRDYHNTLTSKLSKRLSRSIPFEGFIKYDPIPALVP